MIRDKGAEKISEKNKWKK